MSQEHLQAKWAVTSPSVHFQQTKSKPFIAIDISSRNRQEPRHSALEHNCNSTSSSSPRCWSLAPGRGGIQKWRLKSMKIECYQYRRIRACPHRHLERNTTPETEKITPAAIQKGSKSPKSYHLEMILHAQNHIQSYPNLACCASSSPSDYLNPWPLSSKIWGFRVENNFHIPKSLLRNAGTPTMQIFNHRNFHIALPSNRRLPVRQHPGFFSISLQWYVLLQISRKLSTKSHTARPPWQGIAARPGSLTTRAVFEESDFMACCIAILEMRKEIANSSETCPLRIAWNEIHNLVMFPATLSNIPDYTLAFPQRACNEDLLELFPFANRQLIWFHTLFYSG